MNKKKKKVSVETNLSKNYKYYKSLLSQLQDETQNKIVLEYLLTHKAMTTFDAYEKFGITRLPSRVNDLRNMGVDIKCEMKFKGKKHWGIYSLSERGIKDDNNE